jgi:glycosyltransferase involved in cell wall biosynthesis
MEKYSVLLDFEKLRNPYGGMGQVCLHFGQELTHTKIPEQLKLEIFAPRQYRREFKSLNCSFHSYRGMYKWMPVGLKAHDLWHSMSHDSKYMPKFRKTKIIQTIHDLNFLFDDRRNNTAPHLNIMQKAVDRAHHVVTISQYTKKLLLENIKVDPSKVSVVYWGSTLKTFPATPRPFQIQENESFIFALGHFFWKKNFHPLLHLLPTRPKLKLVLAGESNTEYGQQVKELAEKLKVTQQLLLVGKISEQEKYWYMKNAKAVMVPSLQEGFGLPVVEAMSLGQRVFCSQETSLPEIGGSYAFYFDQFDADSVNATYDKYIDAPIDRSDIHRFSWKNCVEQYLSLYQKALM